MADWATLATRVNETLRDSALGEDVIFRPVAGPEVALRGIFDDSFREASVLGDIPVIDAEIVLQVELADLPDGSPVPGERVLIRQAEYIVRSVEEDGHGGARLRLEEGA